MRPSKQFISETVGKHTSPERPVRVATSEFATGHSSSSSSLNSWPARTVVKRRWFFTALVHAGRQTDGPPGTRVNRDSICHLLSALCRSVAQVGDDAYDFFPTRYSTRKFPMPFSLLKRLLTSMKLRRTPWLSQWSVRVKICISLFSTLLTVI